MSLLFYNTVNGIWRADTCDTNGLIGAALNGSKEKEDLLAEDFNLCAVKGFLSLGNALKFGISECS